MLSPSQHCLVIFFYQMPILHFVLLRFGCIPLVILGRFTLTLNVALRP